VANPKNLGQTGVTGGGREKMALQQELATNGGQDPAREGQARKGKREGRQREDEGRFAGKTHEYAERPCSKIFSPIFSRRLKKGAPPASV